MSLDVILDKRNEFAELYGVLIFHFGCGFKLSIKYAQISKFCNFSHLTIESGPSFPPVIDGLLLHEDVWVIINELFDGWEILIEAKTVDFRY